MKRLLAFVVGFFLISAVWAAPGSCTNRALPADPVALAKALLPQLERLYEAIPVLSPREEQWLDDEMNRQDAARIKRAIESREYWIRQAKWDAGSLLASLRVLTKAIKPATPERPIDQWTRFVYALIDYDAGLYLARLEGDGVIKSDSLPELWTMFGTRGTQLADSIRMYRSILARHILICTIPAVAN